MANRARPNQWGTPLTSVEIRPGTVRDVSWIMANLRPGDDEELRCLMPDGASTGAVGYYTVMGSRCWVAYWKGKPVAAFGVEPFSLTALNVWALGTQHMHRVIPAITDFMALDVVPELIDAGYQIMEARSLATHEQAHAWMQSTGAEKAPGAFPYGKGGEEFILFRWTVSGYRSTRGRKSRWNRDRRPRYVHEHVHPESTETPPASED